MSVSTSKIALLKTQEYFNKISSVTTDAKDRASVFKFVEGIHDLGLWNNMACWLFQSSQNTGTGTTAFSLGGLGPFDANLVNGPIWGTEGVTLDGTDDYIIAQTNIDTKNSSIFQVNKIITPSSGFASYFGGGDASSISGQDNLIVHQGSSSGGGFGITQSNSNIAENTASNGSNFFAIAFNGGATSFTGRTVGGSNALVSSNYISTNCVNCGKLGIGCHFFVNTPVGFSNINVAMNIIFNIPNVDLTNLIYPLCRSTIGEELGLPPFSTPIISNDLITFGLDQITTFDSDQIITF